MISVTSAMLAALGRPITEPGLFVELAFPALTVRVTDRGARSWNSQTWMAASIALSSYSVADSIAQAISLTIDDADLSFTALALDPLATGRAVRVWYFDAAASATADPVLLFDGQMDDAQGGHARKVTLDCSVLDRQMPVGRLSQVVPAYMFAEEGKPVLWGNARLTFTRRPEYN
jgi:hypothetical protein